MSIIQRVPWQVQPQRSVEANRGNPNVPTSPTLGGLWNFGVDPRNVANGKLFTRPNASIVPNVRASAAGIGLGLTSGTVRVAGDSPALLTDIAQATWSSMSFLMVLTPLTAPVSGGQYSSLIQNGQLTFNWDHFDAGYRAGIGLFNSGAYPNVLFSSGAFVVGVPTVVGATYDGTTLRLYKDGRLDGSGAMGNGTVGVTLRGVQLLSCNGDTVTPGAIVHSFMWDQTRALSDSTMRTLTNRASYWQLFAPQTRRIWVPVTAGGGSTITGSLGTATASGHTATVNANRTIAGALGTASASGFQGTVSNSTDTTISGALGTATASGFTATVNANRTIAGTLGTAVASGLQGTVSNSSDTVIGGTLGIAVASGLLGTVAWNRFITGLLGTATASGFTGTVSNNSPTVGRPGSDTSNTGWTASTGSDLYAMLDEVTPDAGDYIVTTATGSVCELALNTTAYPGTATQKLSFRGSSSTGNSVIVRLMNTGGATVRTATQVLTSTDTLYEITLTAPEIAAITSGALSVQLESA